MIQSLTRIENCQKEREDNGSTRIVNGMYVAQDDTQEDADEVKMNMNTIKFI